MKMKKVSMFYPSSQSEKGISAYSINLINSIMTQGLKIDRITFTQGKPLGFFSKLSQLLASDVIHIQHEYNLLGGYGSPYFVLLGLLALFRKKGLVITMHTVLSQNEKFRSGKLKTTLRKLLYRLQNRWINVTCSHIIVHSEAFKKILVQEYKIPKEKVFVFPQAIIEDIKITPKEIAKKQLNLLGPVYLLIGTMVFDHGHDIIIRQADKIGKTILVATNPVAINYRNEGRIKEFLELNQKIVKDNHFEKQVRFDLGTISYEKWWKYFSAADLVLLSYRGGIGSGIFADAMAAQKPVVTSNIPYFKEFAKNYSCIEIAETDSDFPRAIRAAMKPENYEKMLRDCRKFLKQNGLTSIAKKYRQFYESL